ncbi:MAG: membrane protein of unknown function [Promethearchaeota archaeon]|nr:MAG: membrane protein of unknown function [Candidatus Lokiarchaeota archaeon]
MSNIIKFKEWSQKEQLLKAFAMEGILLSVSLILLFFTYGLFGDILAWIALIAIGFSLIIPVFTQRNKKTKHIISLKELKILTDSVEKHDPTKKESKVKAVISLIIFIIDVPFLLLIPIFLILAFSLFQIIPLSILYGLVQFFIGIGISYEKVADERKIEMIYPGSIEDTINVADIINESYDVREINIEIWVGETPKKIQMGYTSILFTLSKYKELETKIFCAGFWGVGLEMTAYLNGMEMSDKSYSKEVDLTLEYKPHLEFKKDKKGYKIQIIYVPAEEEDEEVRSLNQKEWKKIVDLLISTIEDNISDK